MKNKRSIIIYSVILFIAVSLIVCMFTVPIFKLTLNGDAENPLSVPIVDGKPYTFWELITKMNFADIFSIYTWQFDTVPVWLTVVFYGLHLITFIGLLFVVVLVILSIIQSVTKLTILHNNLALKIVCIVTSLYGIVGVLINLLSFNLFNDNSSSYVLIDATAGLFIMGALLIILLGAVLFSKNKPKEQKFCKTKAITIYSTILALSVSVFIFMFLPFDKAGNILLNKEFLETSRTSFKFFLQYFAEYAPYGTIPVFVAIVGTVTISLVGLLFTIKNKEDFKIQKILKLFSIIFTVAFIIYYLLIENFVSILHFGNVAGGIVQQSIPITLTLLIMWLIPILSCLLPARTKSNNNK